MKTYKTSKEKYMEEKFGGPDIPLSNWYSEGVLIAKQEQEIKPHDKDDYTDVEISSLHHPTNQKYTVESLWLDNIKGIEFRCCHEDHYHNVKIIDGKVFVVYSEIVVDGKLSIDEREISGTINVWNNKEQRYEYYSEPIKGKYPSKEEYKKYLWDRGIVR